MRLGRVTCFSQRHMSGKVMCSLQAAVEEQVYNSSICSHLPNFGTVEVCAWLSFCELDLKWLRGAVFCHYLINMCCDRTTTACFDLLRFGDQDMAQ